MKKFAVLVGLYFCLSAGLVVSMYTLLSRDCPQGTMVCVGEALGKGAAAFNKAYEEAVNETETKKQDCRQELPDSN